MAKSSNPFDGEIPSWLSITYSNLIELDLSTNNLSSTVLSGFNACSFLGLLFFFFFFGGCWGVCCGGGVGGFLFWVGGWGVVAGWAWTKDIDLTFSVDFCSGLLDRKKSDRR